MFILYVFLLNSCLSTGSALLSYPDLYSPWLRITRSDTFYNNQAKPINIYKKKKNILAFIFVVSVKLIAKKGK